MTERRSDFPLADRAAALLAKLAQLVPAMQARAAVHDHSASFPADDMAALRDEGLLAAALPVRLGGLGAGTEPDGADLVRDALMLLGRGNLSVARLFEAHVNALRLIECFGSAEQRARAAADVFAGHLFGLWVTDPPGRPGLRVRDQGLTGTKGPCSGAGHCTRAIVTVETDTGTRMAVIGLSGNERVQPVAGLQGMRAAANGTVALDGARLLFWLGMAGDYMREPEFSCGAWRGSAAAAGGLAALIEAVGQGLRRRDQSDAPMQLARYGELLIAAQTAKLWVAHAADAAERSAGTAEERVAAVNLARIAVESAGLAAIRLAQRALGLAAFVAPHPAERIMRDLATYLRQPAPDAVLVEAAAWTLRQTAPP